MLSEFLCNVAVHESFFPLAGSQLVNGVTWVLVMITSDGESTVVWQIMVRAVISCVAPEMTLSGRIPWKVRVPEVAKCLVIKCVLCMNV